jgi:hypothetical protein
MLMTRAEKMVLKNQILIMQSLSVMMSDQHVMMRSELTKNISRTFAAVDSAKHLTGDTP